ncbi:hypothetical protein AK830_g6720 [Neonectria ditissima]|uniref:Heterokaryon incompatibility domain-containing protein n=1 Tax=Neonectria ditissima TaxID=78410 RepID=A0A0P7BH97_9HYPO|nr:hypothetical protein AK830_g6720 [Neonectria ditissima]
MVLPTLSHILRSSAAAPNLGTCILEVPFATVTVTPVSIANAAKYKYRLLDCRAFAERKSLRILEFEDLPEHKYGTISYVWRGLQPKDDSPPIIAIDGTKGNGKASVDLLRLACVALLRLGCDLVWLDGLCIIQGDKDDKDWQMQRMYGIYKKCKTCLVIPGGLLRLTELTEETTWIHRAWTLQEAIAPSSAECLFAWKDGDCTLQTNMSTAVSEVEEGVAAIADMKSLLETSLKADYRVSKFDEDSGVSTELPDGEQIKLLGQGSQLDALIGALDLREQEGMENAIWRSSFMRTAKFPEDNVFSIMGLMGVTLNTKAFKEGERLEATIALMQAMLEKGHRAEWLGIATRIENNPRLSTIPAFPEPNPDGRAVVTTAEGDKEVASLIDGWWMIADTPKGTLDVAGYLDFKAQAAPVRKRQDGSSRTGFASVDGRQWEVLPASSGPLYAVVIGTKTPYLNGVYPSMVDPDSVVLMLVEERVGGKFCAIEYAFISEDKTTGDGWGLKTFKVGGPTKNDTEA